MTGGEPHDEEVSWQIGQVLPAEVVGPLRVSGEVLAHHRDFAASRVWLGVHWPSDVVGGVLVAILGILGSERLITLLHDRRGKPPCGQEGITQEDWAARPGS